MKIAENKTAVISIAILLIISMAASTMLIIPNTSAHTPSWQIPTYAQIVAEPDPVGVGQKVHVYMWLEPVYGVAGGSTPVAGTNGSTASSALLSNNYRFHDYNLTITAPDGTVTTQIFPVVVDTTSSQFTSFVPDQVGTYTIKFSYPGQAYGANGNGYINSILINDTYLASSATENVTVQQDPIPAAINSYPLPTEYWTRPIYGENTDWWTISSNWLGTGSAINPAYGQGTITGFSQSQMNRYPGDAVGSLTAHIMWTKPLEMGGVVGGQIGSATPGLAWFEGSAYNNRVQNPIIINGILYYTEPDSFTGTTAGPTVAVDLRTGKEIWSRNDVPSLSLGYIYNLWNPDQHGVFPAILFTNSFGRAFDAYTGTQLFNTTGVPGGAISAGPNGEQLRYVFQNLGNATNPNWYLAQWNSSRLWQQSGSNPFASGSSLLSPQVINYSTTNPAMNNILVSVPQSITTGGTLNTILVNANIPINSTTSPPGVGWSIASYDWNYSVSTLNTMPYQAINSTTGLPQTPSSLQLTLNPSSTLAAFAGNMLILRNGSLPVGFAANNVGYPQQPFTLFALNLNASRGDIGSLLWMKTYNPLPGNLTYSYGGADPTAPNGNGNGVFVFGLEETINWIGFSMSTGEQLWGPTPSQPAFDYYGNPIYPYVTGQVAYGKLYSSGFAGVLHCYDLTTGNILWTYGNGGEGNNTKAGLNTFYGDYPTFINAVGNGVIYEVTTEHTITDPIYKGAMARAINATDGTEIWTLSDYTGEFGSCSYAIADGYNVIFNGYDDSLYTVGRGPSVTSVSVGPAASVLGGNVVITGSVMDTASGTTQDTQAARFPHGVPVSSDASMKDWMGYVYQQKPYPTNFTGVSVGLYVVDANGNYRSIGSTTTDNNGDFSLTWTPDIPGDYKVYASFAGTQGYWPSTDTTAFNVVEANPTASPAPEVAPSLADQYFIPAIAGLFVFVAIMGVVNHPGSQETSINQTMGKSFSLPYFLFYNFKPHDFSNYINSKTPLLTLRHPSEAQQLPDQPALKEQIHQANVVVHRFEAKYYEPLHPEVYSKQEQKRVTAKLKQLDEQITNNKRNALDVGAGTGNLTGKLLNMGYTVTATDISLEMCQILQQKFAIYLPSKLTVINSPIEDLSFSKGQFDLVTFYSVLHHLPDYLDALRVVSGYLKKGGVMYIDHEASPFYWKKESNSFASLVKDLYFHSNPILNSLYFQITGLKVPTIDYTLSDYWHKKEHAVNHQCHRGKSLSLRDSNFLGEPTIISMLHGLQTRCIQSIGCSAGQK